MNTPIASPPGAPAASPDGTVVSPSGVGVSPPGVAMSPPDAAARLRDLRLAGDLQAAVAAVPAALAAGPPTPAVAAEAVRVLIAAGQPAPAARLCHLLAATRPGGGPALEPAATARLALQLGQPALLAGLPVAEGPGWLAGWRRDGEDPCRPLEIRDLAVAIVNGPVLYTVTGACPWCGHARAFALRATLLTSVEGLCPACFGRAAVTWETLRAFIRERFPGLVADGAGHADHDLIEHVRQRLLDDPDVPEIVRSLGQEYHFLLNELLVGRRLAAAGNADGNAADRGRS